MIQLNILKKYIITFLVILFINIPSYATNWVTIKAENGKSADLDIDSIQVILNTVEYDIKIKKEILIYINKFSTELYKKNTPTAIIKSTKYIQDVKISSETYDKRNYRELKPGTLQAEIFDVLSKQISRKELRKGQKMWKKYLKDQQHTIQKQWKTYKFSDYDSQYVTTFKKEPLYTNNINIDIAKDGRIINRKSKDYKTNLIYIDKLDPLPDDYTAKTFNLNIDMKYYKYAGAKVYNKGEKVKIITPTKSNITISKNSKPPIIGHIQYGLLKTIDLELLDICDKIPIIGDLLKIPIAIFEIIEKFSLIIVYAIIGGDCSDIN